MKNPREFKIRRVMDTDSIREDVEARLALAGMIGYLLSYDMLNVSIENSSIMDGIDQLMLLLMNKSLLLVNYGDPHDPTQWQLEEGPALTGKDLRPVILSPN